MLFRRVSNNEITIPNGMGPSPRVRRKSFELSANGKEPEMQQEAAINMFLR